MIREKKCTKCGEVKGLECFSKHKRDGLQSWCKVCKREYQRENKEYLKDYYRRNKERLKEYKRKHRQENKDSIEERERKYRQENKEILKDRKKKHYQENKEHYQEYVRKWAEENPDKVNARNAKRRSRKLRATPEWLTEQQNLKIKLYYKIAKALEMMDGVKRHVDHIIPLKGKGVRGLHVPWNLQILTAEQNLSKNNSYSDW